jgi:hypothetical protein
MQKETLKKAKTIGLDRLLVTAWESNAPQLESYRAQWRRFGKPLD